MSPTQDGPTINSRFVNLLSLLFIWLVETPDQRVMAEPNTRSQMVTTAS